MLAGGVKIMGEITNPCKVSRVDVTTFRMILTQGLNRQIRRMCSALGYQTRRLRRIRIINIRLDKMPVGSWRNLTPAEVAGLLPRGARGGQQARSVRESMPSDQRLPLVVRHSGSTAREASQRKKSAP